MCFAGLGAILIFTKVREPLSWVLTGGIVLEKASQTGRTVPVKAQGQI